MIALDQQDLHTNYLTRVKFPAASITHIPDFSLVNNALNNIEFTSPAITFGIDPFSFNQLSYLTIPAKETAEIMKNNLNLKSMASSTSNGKGN